MIQQVQQVDTKGRYQYWSFTGVQSAANAFKEIEIPTGLTPDGGLVAVIDQVSLVTTGSLVTGLADQQAALTRKTQAAMLTYDDAQIVAYGQKKLELYETGGVIQSGSGISDDPWILDLPLGFTFVADSSVFLQFDSSGFFSAKTLYGRIRYTTQKMSKSDILDILYG